MSCDAHNILCSKTVLRILSNKVQFEVCAQDQSIFLLFLGFFPPGKHSLHFHFVY